MELTATLGAARYMVKLHEPWDISIPISFEGSQLSVFGAPAARREPYRTEGFTGAVRHGGSCNCDMLTFSPHLNGTHTECAGHIADGLLTVHDVLKDVLFPATLITVVPEPAEKSHETYDPPLRPADLLITRDALKHALLKASRLCLQALVIRTLPNDAEKMTRNYNTSLPPFFSTEAMQHINDIGVQHLLVDIPSIDRLDDEGRLSNHHLFWGIKQGSHEVDRTQPSPKTITELIYAPHSLADGQYMLNLQVAAFMSDAAPSRPILYEIERK